VRLAGCTTMLGRSQYGPHERLVRRLLYARITLCDASRWARLAGALGLRHRTPMTAGCRRPRSEAGPLRAGAQRSAVGVGDRARWLFPVGEGE